LKSYLETNKYHIILAQLEGDIMPLMYLFNDDLVAFNTQLNSYLDPRKDPIATSGLTQNDIKTLMEKGVLQGRALLKSRPDDVRISFGSWAAMPNACLKVCDLIEQKGIPLEEDIVVAQLIENGIFVFQLLDEDGDMNFSVLKSEVEGFEIVVGDERSEFQQQWGLSDSEMTHLENRGVFKSESMRFPLFLFSHFSFCLFSQTAHSAMLKQRGKSKN
jgi:hypothetical protein